MDEASTRCPSKTKRGWPAGVRTVKEGLLEGRDTQNGQVLEAETVRKSVTGVWGGWEAST